MSEDIDIKVKAEEVEEDDLQVLTVIQLSKKKPVQAKAKRRYTPEDSAKRSTNRRQFLAKLSEEERKRRRDEDNAQRRLRRQQKREAGMTEAEIEQDRLRWERRRKGRKRLSDDELGEEVKRILIEKRDKWKHKVKWEEGPTGKLLMTRKEMEAVKRVYQTFLLQQRKNEKMSEEELAQRKQAHSFQQFVRNAHMTEEERKVRRVKQFISRRALWASKSEEEQRLVREKQRARCRHWKQNVEGEKKARNAQNVRKAVGRWHAKNRERIAEWHRQKRLNETPEQRRMMLLFYRINQAKGKLKRKLAEEGLPQKVIQQRVEELERRMRSEPLPPLEQISSYKPKPRKNPPNQRTPERRARERDAPVAKENQNVLQTPAPSSMSQSQCEQSQTQSNQSLENVDANVEGFPSAPSSPLPPHSGPEESPPSPEDMTNDHDHGPSNEPVEEDDIGITVEYPAGDMEQVALVVTATPTGIPPSPQQNLPTPKPNPADHHKCPHCTAAAFPQQTQLHSHLCSTHPEKCWRCPKCSAVVHSPQELMTHFKTHHPKSSAAKDEEEDLIQNRAGRRRPGSGRSPVSPSPFTCMKCPGSRNFDTHPKLTAHVRATHPNSFWPCPLCKLLKYNEASLTLHSKICRRSRERIEKQQRKCKPKKPEGPVCFCKLCGKGFTQTVSLRIHTNDVHLQLRNHECDLCGKRFKRASTRNTHRQLIHFGVSRRRR